MINTEWILENGIIKGVTNNNDIVFPMAKELYESKSSIFIDNVEYSFDMKEIRFFKIVSIPFFAKFELVNGHITLKLYANKQNEIVEISSLNGQYVDYCIINNTWYYFNNNIHEINKRINENNIDIEDISFFNYINLVNYLQSLNIELNDCVADNIKQIKTTSNVVNYDILFPYQKLGVNWLTYMVNNKCGCILADSMGLGKTPQIIFLIANMKKKNDKVCCLVVAPVSLLENWKREIEKFYPDLKCYVNYGEDKIYYYKELLNYNVIIDSYNGIQSSFGMYQMIKFDAVILDEAQNIKNPDANRTKAVKELKRDIGIAVTGTPLENHLTDIWSITDFVLPNYLGTKTEFKKDYGDNNISAYDIEKKITPIMIRRKVEDVAKDLPDRIDIPQPIHMTIDEARLYDNELHNVGELKKITIDKMQKLRMFCTHPNVYNHNSNKVDPYLISEKYQRLCEIIDEIVENKEKVIIFTTFNEMINLLVNDLRERYNVPTMYINGTINPIERQPIIDEYSNIQGSAILILNPKAAGAGLNITAANHVIHYNLEWNPAVEDQASARAYRTGQKKTVFVHRLFYINTIEEVINEKIERKRELSDIAIVGNDGELNSNDIAKVLSMSPLNSNGGIK